MRIITDPNEHSIDDKLCAALGYFDGFHIGHMRILEETKKSGLKSAVVTFSNRPSDYIQNKKASCRIMSIADKISFLEQFGIDYLFLYEFDSRMMNTSAEDFVRDFLLSNNVKRAVAGYNYTFGKFAEGNTDMLGKLCAVSGIEVKIVPEVLLEGRAVSSSLIRANIAEGNVELVGELLGRAYSLSGRFSPGEISKGCADGQREYELEVSSELILPKAGVYYAQTEIKGKYYPCAVCIREDRAAGANRPSIKIHISEIKEDCKELIIEFVSKISQGAKRGEAEDGAQYLPNFAPSRGN
ncbi:MAG: hypothetical protein GX061_02110 [Eubacteriaceae bacterium]|nr:hypothetical protein [Eubacteriaceae bacterium]